MQNVKMLADVLDVARSSTDRWYVTNGATAVGPVNLELLTRGLEAGKVPISSFIRHEAWKVWRPVCELAEITNDDGEEAADVGRISIEDVFSGVSQPSIAVEAPVEAPSQPGTPPAQAPPTPGAPLTTGSPGGAPLTTGSPGGAPEPAGEVVSAASDRRDALLLLLAAAVSRGQAEVAMIHEVADEGADAVCAHGPQVFEALGLRTRLLDPALLAAAAGPIVISEPTPGPAGQAIIARLSLLGVPVESAVMLPIRPHGRLFGTIELGRRTAFRPRDVAGLETLVEAVVGKLEALAPRRQN